MPLDSLSFQTFFGSEAIATLFTTDNSLSPSTPYADFSDGLQRIRNIQTPSPQSARIASKSIAQDPIDPTVSLPPSLQNQDWTEVLDELFLGINDPVAAEDENQVEEEPHTTTANFAPEAITLFSEQDKESSQQTHQFNRITPTLLITWQTNQQQPETQRLSAKQFADTHNIAITTLANYIQRDGTLRARGENMLQRAQGHRFNQINADILNAWQKNQQMPEGQRLTSRQFAHQCNIAISGLNHYINSDGILNLRGQSLLQRGTDTARAKKMCPKAANHNSNSMTQDILITWQRNQQRLKNQQLTQKEFANAHNIRPTTLARYIDTNGILKPLGNDLMRRKGADHRFQPIQAKLLTLWQTNQQQAPELRLSFEQFAVAHNVAEATLALYIYADNGTLKQQGKNMLQRSQGHRFNSISKRIWNAWQINQQQPINQRLTLEQFADTHNIASTILTQYIYQNGTLKALGQRVLQRTPRQQFNPITSEILTTWQNNTTLPDSQRLSLTQFSEKYNIAVATLMQYSHADGTLTKYGRDAFQRKEYKTLTYVTADILHAWQINHQRPEDQRLTYEQFANAHNIAIKTLTHYINANGTLTLYAKDMLKQKAGHQFTSITPCLLAAWQTNQQQPINQRLTREQFTNKHNIMAQTLHNYADSRGNFKEAGRKMLAGK